MEPPLNCSALYQSHIETTMDRAEALGVLQELCRVSRASDRTQLSAAVQGILGSLLTCGLLLSLFFAIFTARFRQNRIVKMSSPNLNLVILLGSLVTHVSAFMFAVQESVLSMQTVIQVRISLLYIGVSLIFGPLLGKSWRLHRVFTHRIPDKRVIIKDVTLLGLQGALLFTDAMLLLAWVLTDPVLCAQSVSASIKAAERGTHCAVTRILSCSSLYADFWVTLLLGFKALLLIYGSYLAGLTKNISTPPVNQSLVIMVGTTLVAVGTGVALLVTRFFHNWPNLVYGVTSGSILICTTTITCLIFIPQLLQWRQFEEEPSHSTVQMAKYFHSPSRSMRSMYSEEQIYHLLGENTSMRRLLTEKNAVIDSLQEQVINAKEKLEQILKSECSVEVTDVEALPSPTLTAQQDADQLMNNNTQLLHDDGAVTSQPRGEDLQETAGSDLPASECSVPKQETGGAALPRNVSFVDKASRPPGEATAEAWERWKVNYVSCEKLQEVLRELSVETLSGGCPISPGRLRRASHSGHRDPTGHSTEGFRNVSLSFSPSMARRRRGLAYSRRRNARASIPHTEGRLIAQGATGRHVEGPTQHMGHTTDHMSPHLPSPADNTELGVQAGGSRAPESGGLWVTSSHVIGRGHMGLDAHDAHESPSSESDTSSSEEAFCRCHRPYCDVCFLCDTSDSEPGDWPTNHAAAQLVVNFKEDLQPTFV